MKTWLPDLQESPNSLEMKSDSDMPDGIWNCREGEGNKFSLLVNYLLLIYLLMIYLLVIYLLVNYLLLIY